jgi:hypothetical protein
MNPTDCNIRPQPRRAKFSDPSDCSLADLTDSILMPGFSGALPKMDAGLLVDGKNHEDE